MPITQLKKQSFTLIEIIASMTIFMVAIAPLLGLLMKTTKVYSDNNKRIQAQMLAKDEFSRLKPFSSNVNFKGVYNATTFNSAANNLMENWGKHPRYKNLYYKVTGSYVSYELCVFNLSIAYSKSSSESTPEETYNLYIAAEE